MKQIGWAIDVEGKKPTDTIYTTRAEFLGGLFGFSLDTAIGTGLGNALTGRKSEYPRIMTYDVFEDEKGQKQYVLRSR